MQDIIVIALFLAFVRYVGYADAFLPTDIPVPPHLQWLYGTPKPGNNFGYGGNKATGNSQKTGQITQMTQSAGSEKKDPDSGSLEYQDIMSQLDGQSNKKTVTVTVAGETYIIRNPYGDSAYELSDKLAEKIYNQIRESDTDVCEIAQNLGFKADNIKNVKDHVFYNEHNLDRYGPDEVECKRFDPTLSQALAWKRLEAGTHSADDIMWIKHECAERHYELRFDSGYSEAHERAQSRFDGAPCDDKF